MPELSQSSSVVGNGIIDNSLTSCNTFVKALLAINVFFTFSFFSFVQLCDLFSLSFYNQQISGIAHLHFGH